MSASSKSSTTTLPITFEDVKSAAVRIRGKVIVTPAEHAEVLSEIIGCDTFLKLEIFQHTASFKERGALNKLLTLTEQEKKHGVIAASAGNHAQGVAYCAGKLNIPATIVMPKDTPFTKIRRTESFGATTVLAGSSLSEATAEAKKLAAKNSMTLIPTYDDPYVMAGHGTVALEFLEKFPELDVLVVPIGGGGLISGVAVAAKAIKPSIKIFGVQSEVYPAMKAALQGQTIAPTRQTVAEGIAVKEPGSLTRTIVASLVDDILIVSESQIERAINMFIEIEKIVAEGAGAAPLAALLQYPNLFKGLKVGLIVCGGNIDPKILAFSLMRGLARDGRISRFRVTAPDLPGSLAKLTTVVAEQGGNVIEVYHQRQFANIALKYTDIELILETKDAKHRDHILKELETAGFEVECLTYT